MRTAVAIVIGLLLSGSAIAGPCPTPCKKQFNLAFKGCRGKCPKRRAGRACRSQCGAQRAAARSICRRSANPTPPLCGAQPAITPTTSTTIATSPTTSSTVILSTTVTTTSSTTTTMFSCSNQPDETVCSDGNACTTGDRCQAGSCVPSNTVSCVAQDQCHDAGTCDPATGVCSNPPKANGTACNDGNPCTLTDSCQGGTCTGATPVQCAAPGQCQNAGTCNPATGQCVYPSKTDGTACTDGNGCTGGDTCHGGTCVAGPAVVCPSAFPTQCTTAIEDCDPNNGQCFVRPVANGTACDDGNACTSGDSCQAGVCTGTACAPGHVCCSTEQPCVDLNLDSANCGTCGHACTNSVCLFGQCYDGCVIDGVGYPRGASDPAFPGGSSVCDTSKSRTTWTRLGENYPNPPLVTCAAGCFSGFCNRGGCTVMAQIGAGGACPTASICSAGSCNQNALCVQTPINEGAACTPPLSTNACLSATTATCQNGQCIPVAANEGGFCVPAVGTTNPCLSSFVGTCHDGVCKYNQLADGTSCPSNPPNQCKTGVCSGGACQVSDLPSGTPCTPDPTNRCMLGVCNPSGMSPGFCGKTIVNGEFGMKTCPDACGTGTTCDPATGSCGGDRPSIGEFACDATMAFGPNPSKCCPGQVCICGPTGTGIPSFCLDYGCWNPEDVPGHFE